MSVRELVSKQHQATSSHDLLSFPEPLYETDIIVPVSKVKKLNQKG